MQTFAYIASLLIGVSLGLIGGGGSILTVPVLVYLFGINPVLSTSYSLFIVGSTSLAGAINNYTKGLVSIKTALFFGISSIATTFLTRKFIVPIIPQHIATIGKTVVTHDVLTMLLFAALMIIAAVAMIRGRHEITKDESENSPKYNLVRLSLFGTGIGVATGLLGAGGGFLLIPILVLLVGLPMKKAVGTSLLIIALNSLIGFTGDLGQVDIDWALLVRIASFATAGIFIGGAIGKKIAGEKLKKAFGWFVLTMGIVIIFKELFY
jgi:hypothetical protein